MSGQKLPPFPEDLPTALQEDAARSLQRAQDLVWACHEIDDALKDVVYDLRLGDGRS